MHIYNTQPQFCAHQFESAATEDVRKSIDPLLIDYLRRHNYNRSAQCLLEESSASSSILQPNRGGMSSKGGGANWDGKQLEELLLKQQCRSHQNPQQQPDASSSINIPTFFHQFLGRLRQLAVEYAAELAKFSDSDALRMRQFSCRQEALYGKRVVPCKRLGSGGTKERRRRRTKNGNNNIFDSTNPNGATESQLPAFAAFPVDNPFGGGKIPPPRPSASSSTTAIQLPPQFLAQHHQQQPQFSSPAKRSSTTAGRNTGQIQFSPSAQKRKGRGPLSIGQRLDSSLAAAASAVNQHIPLDQLEQTVSSVLPESILESQDFTAYLRQYLENFDEELGQTEGPKGVQVGEEGGEGNKREEEVISDQQKRQNGRQRQENGERGKRKDECAHAEKPERTVVIDEDEPSLLMEEGEMEEQTEDWPQGNNNNCAVEGGHIIQLEAAQLELLDHGRVHLFTPSPNKMASSAIWRQRQERREHGREGQKTPNQQESPRPSSSSMLLISPKLISQRVLIRSAPIGARIAARKGQNWGSEKMEEEMGRANDEGRKEGKLMTAMEEEMCSDDEDGMEEDEAEIIGQHQEKRTGDHASRGREEAVADMHQQEMEESGEEGSASEWDQPNWPIMDAELIGRVLNFVHQ